MNCFANIANKVNLYLILFTSVLFVLMLLSGMKSHAQCAVDPDDYYTSYQQTLNSFSGNIREVGKDIETNANNVSILAGQLMLIPDGVSFVGSINSVAPDAAVCIAEGGVFNPSSFNNAAGIMRNYNTSNILSISSKDCQLENYGGIIEITSSQSQNIFNFDDGIITINGDLNIGSSILYNDGSLTINKNFSGNDACVINNDEIIIQSSVTGSFDLTNNGQFIIDDKMHGSGTLENQGWMTIGNYIANYSFINYGKVEILGKNLHFNSGGEVFNYCSFFSFTEGSSFQNNTNIYNYGLIYFPNGTWSNKQTFTNGKKGIVRTYDLTNENGIVTGSGKFYVVGYSLNRNGHAEFGLSGDTINFYDASNVNNPGHFDRNKATIGNAVYYTEFPEPEYSPDLSLYECGEIILSEIDAGEIGYDQVVCQGMTVQPLVSISPAYMDGNPTITYQWQYKYPGDEYFTDISGANTIDYNPDTATVDIQYRRKAFFSFPDNPIKDCKYGSNIVSIVISDELPPEITVHPSDTTVCPGSPASFTVASNDDLSNQFQWMSRASTEQEWTPINESGLYAGTTNQTLQITNTGNLNGYQFACEVSREVCGAVFSNSAQVVHFPDSIPILTVTPEDQYLCVDENSAQFTVETESKNITFQWQESTDGGTVWNNIADGENYQGTNTKNLVVTGSALVSGNQYKCIASSENDCFEAQSVTATLYRVVPGVVAIPVSEVKCPDTNSELGFSGLDNNYQMGNSVITFLVQRNTIGPFTWSFSYQLDISNPELLVDSQSQGNIEISDTNTTLFPLTFYIENQTEEIVTATLKISNVEVAGCNESSDENPNHTSSMQVHKMPLVGEFKKD